MKNELLPLSIGQKGVAYLHQQFPDTPANNIGGLVLFDEKLDFDILEKAIVISVQRNDGLRLRMYRKKKPFMDIDVLLKDIILQYVNDEPKVEVGFHDFTGCSMQEMEETILQWNSIPIDIFESPLYEFKMLITPDGKSGIYAKLDHIITDAWNSALLCKEVIEIYYALLRSEQLPKPLYPFLSYLKNEESYVGSPQYKADRDFWMSKFDTKPASTCFRQKGKPSTTGKSFRFSTKIDQDKSKIINDFCYKNKVTPVTFFTFLTCMCLSHFTGKNEANICSPVMFRSTLTEKRTCGPLVNLQLLRIFFDENKTFVDSCKELNNERLTSMRHIKFPYLHLLTEIFKKHFVSDFKDTMLSFPTAKIETKEKVKFETRWLPSGVFPNPFSIYVTDIDNTGEYNLQFEYHIDTYSPEFVNEIYRNFMTFLDYSIANPSAVMKDIFKVT